MSPSWLIVCSTQDVAHRPAVHLRSYAVPFCASLKVLVVLILTRRSLANSILGAKHNTLRTAPHMFLYVGAGTDIRRALRISNNKDMILIDCQPFSEYGKLEGFSRPRFVPMVERLLLKHGFTKESSREWIHESSTGQTLTYYMNTAIPEDLEILDLAAVDTLFVAGYWPPVALMDALPAHPIHFWGAYGTTYENDTEEGETIISALHTCPAVRARFADFAYLDRNGPTRTFAHWDDFYTAWRAAETAHWAVYEDAAATQSDIT